jgi:hypothetical protein
MMALNQISIVRIGVSRAGRGCGVDPDGISHLTRRFRIELMNSQQFDALSRLINEGRDR